MPSKFKPGDLIRYTAAHRRIFSSLPATPLIVLRAHASYQGCYYVREGFSRPPRWHDEWDEDRFFEFVSPPPPTFTVDYSTDNVDEATEIATILAARLGRAVVVTRI